jgi:hypothetical protein
MFVNWWDNPYTPDAWHKHQVRSAHTVLAAAGHSVTPTRHAHPANNQHLGPPSRALLQLAWWGVAFWGSIFYLAFGRGGKKKEAAPAEAAAKH